MSRTDSILGHGIDIVEIDRIARALADHPQRFPERVFTVTERAYCDLAPRRRAERYAARFAVKEAVLKALGTGWTEGIQKMNKGGKIKLYVPPHLAYGDDGRPGIPPCATLVFDVELLDIKPAAAPAPAPAPAPVKK